MSWLRRLVPLFFGMAFFVIVACPGCQRPQSPELPYDAEFSESLHDDFNDFVGNDSG